MHFYNLDCHDTALRISHQISKSRLPRISITSIIGTCIALQYIITTSKASAWSSSTFYIHENILQCISISFTWVFHEPTNNFNRIGNTRNIRSSAHYGIHQTAHKRFVRYRAGPAKSGALCEPLKRGPILLLVRDQVHDRRHRSLLVFKHPSFPLL
jgi:hypothetical protein